MEIILRIVSPGIHKLLRLAEVGHWKIMSWMGLAYQFNSLWTKRQDSAHMNSLRIEIMLQLNILGGISRYIALIYGTATSILGS
jgi:hypothetical protein